MHKTIQNVKWTEMDGAVRQILKAVKEGRQTIDSATTDILNSMKLLNGATWATAKIDRPIKTPSQAHLNLFPKRPLTPRQYLYGRGDNGPAPTNLYSGVTGDLKPRPARPSAMPIMPQRVAKPVPEVVFSPDMAQAING